MKGEEYTVETFDVNIKTYIFDGGELITSPEPYGELNHIASFEFPKNEFFKILRRMSSLEENKKRDFSIHGGRSSVGRA